MNFFFGGRHSHHNTKHQPPNIPSHPYARTPQINSLSAATEAACVILSIDETVRNPRSKQPGEADANGVGLGRGGPVSAGMGGAGMAGMVGAAGRGRGGMPRGVKAFKGRGGA